MSSKQQGFTLMEMVLYMGMVAIVLPMMVIFLLQVQQTQTLFNARANMEQTAALLHSEFSTELISAQSIRLTESTLESDDGLLVYDDINSDKIEIDRELTTVDFNGTNQSIRRLRMRKDSGPWTWITDRETDINGFFVYEVRDSNLTLTGIRFRLELIMLNPSGNPYRQASFDSSSTINLQPQTTEI